MPAIYWLVLGLVLMVAELFNPGAFLLWLGLGAMLTAAAIMLVADMATVWQFVLFGLFSLVAIVAYQQWRRRNPTSERSDQPLLNRRAAQLVGEKFRLDEPIVDGRGRLKIGDAFWSIHGPDQAAGTHVRVVATDGVSLTVEAA